MATFPLTERAIVLRPEDDVAIAKKELPAGTILEDGPVRIEVRQDVKPGHKVARRRVSTAAPVRRYGQVIGFATQDIEAGDHVHTHNLGIGALQREYEFCTDVRPVEHYPAAAMRYFDGFKREDGRVGTRNYVAIISGVNCSASVSQFVEDHMALQRVLAGYAKHPNIAAYILVGLGCEVNQAAVMVDRQRMAAPG